ncbi:hypothetical protein DFA_11550 [Cavenderia fasciculata]|uniref:Uncharacterized protein n=1 Tax=Cavenderia fasciculata TaxID=261658 RepID=F4QDJ2_CACFS|nr:uncharacterized protein DFA_11550 [Cavenderia fasciculata]EGG13789.1 hypothetical protein DFA_11550 [Cavenderia fasciculata]|eukprot:XP_004350497.1 hypothetical protein DFA_11550 [Cavenderia fasciculata]
MGWITNLFGGNKKRLQAAGNKRQNGMTNNQSFYA